MKLNTIKYHIKYFCYLILVVLTFSCQDFIEIDGPPDQVLSSAVFSDEATAEAAIAGLYSQIMQNNGRILNGGMSVYAGLSADEFYNTASSSRVDPITANAIPIDNIIVQNDIWRAGYIYIYHIHGCLEGLNSSDAIPDETKTQLRGEVLFLRALTYFYMVNLFGDVPLVLDTDYRTNELLARSPASEVYDRIVDDLEEARGLLQKSAPENSGTRVNYWAVTALLSRVYLFREQWQQARELATEVIGSGYWQLESDLDQVFRHESREIIFQIVPVGTASNSAEGVLFIPLNETRIPDYDLRQGFLDAFEPGDLRRTHWVHQSMINGTEYNYPYKYKVRSGPEREEYNVVLRLAEMYLIRAEARLNQGDTEGAKSDINQIRNRAALSDIPGSEGSDGLKDIIRHERRIELFAEWGHRWFDLKRTGETNTILNPLKDDWQPTDELFPIPERELDNNPNLIQNPGY